MSEARWEQIKRIFNTAMERPHAERAAFLDAECGDDAELRREVESLVRAARPTQSPGAVRTGGAADALANATTAAPTSTPLTEKAGTIIGPYKLLQVIGEGGFGTVFMAEQSTPVRRRVALKIIKLGMDTKAVVARFEAERQALALMDHPHIAKVLDGGATPQTSEGGIVGGGRPYFVMEYVTGDPITAFASAHKLSVKERLNLFAQVCAAVQHAHMKGVIHRDIKPGNVLVSMTDGKPFAKVIDFGIAKATAQPLTEKTLFTEHRQLIGTPEYMSPEQAEGSADIDTRTDVYALGVLLYELLTGLTPFDGKRLRSAAYGEMQRIIKEEEPPMPSVRISRGTGVPLVIGPVGISGTGVSPVASPTRPPASAPTAAQVKGELDWIVMKALDKDRTRRYDTPNLLAADVQRHLAGEAVVAAPPSAAYRLRKFVRRNKGVVVTVSAVILALAAGGSVAAWQWSRAEQESSKQRATLSFTREHVIKLWQQQGYADGAPGKLEIGHPQGKLGYRWEFVGDPPVLRFTPLAGQDENDLTKTLVYNLYSSASEYYDDLIETNNHLKAQTDAAEWSAYTANLALAQQSIVNDAYPRARQLLSEVAPRLRGWEWTFLSRRAASVNFVLPETRFFATYVKPGKTILANGYTNTPIIVDSTINDGGRTISRLPGAGSAVTHGIVSPDRRCVALAGLTERENAVQVWRVDDDGQAEKVFSYAVRQQISGLAFSPSGSHLASIDTRAVIRIFDAQTGALAHEFEATSEDGLYSLQFSADGQRLFVSGGVLAVFDLRKDPPSGTTLRSWTSSWLAMGLLSADGKLFATSNADEHQFQIWHVDADPPTPTNVAFDSAAGTISTLGFDARTGQLITAHRSGEIRIWSVDGDVVKPVGTFSGHSQQVEAIELSSKGGTVISGDLSGRVIEWGNDPSFAGYLKPLRSVAIGGRISNLEFSSSPSGKDELLINSSTGEREPGRGLVVVPLHGADPISKMGQGKMQLQIDVAIGPGKLAVPRFDAYEPARAIGPLSVPTADGTRTMWVRNSRELVIKRSDDAREVAVFKMPNDIIGLGLSSDDSQLAIVMHEAGQGVSAQMWDIREPEERRKDLQREWAERVPAGEYLDTLWNAPLTERPTASLREAIINDASLTPLRRLVAVELLEERTQDAKLEAARAFGEITKDQIDAGAVQAKAQAAELPPRVKEVVVASAKGWTYTPPVASDAERLAEETKQRRLAEETVRKLTADALAEETKQRRLAEAALTLYRVQAWDTPTYPGEIADLERAVATRDELLGETNVESAKARWMLGIYSFSRNADVNLDALQKGVSLMRSALEQYRVSQSRSDILLGMEISLAQAEAWAWNFESSEASLRRAQALLVEDGKADQPSLELIFSTVLAGGSGFDPRFHNRAMFHLPGRYDHKLSLAANRELYIQAIDAVLTTGVRAYAINQGASIGLVHRTSVDGTHRTYLGSAKTAEHVARLEPHDARVYLPLAIHCLRKDRYVDGLVAANESIRRCSQSPPADGGVRPRRCDTLLQYGVLAILRVKLASSSDPATLAAAGEIDMKADPTLKAPLTPDEHRQRAREALAKARALMQTAPDGAPSPWADDKHAKVLLAEAEALIEGQATP